MNILTIVEALKMAQDLPFFIVLPIYIIVYAFAALMVMKTFKAAECIEIKKDSELPWVVRIARWVLAVAGSVWAVGYVAHDFLTWFR